MKSIEENTEKLDLLERTLQVEQKQKKRLEAIAIQKQQQMEEANRRQLLEGHSTSSAAVLDQEDAQRKELVDAMIRESTPSNASVVKVLTNVHGNYIAIITFLIDITSKHIYVPVTLTFYSHLS